MSYDSKCYDLAEAFLEDQPISHDHTKRIVLLAQHIQTSIEDWLEMNPIGTGHQPVPVAQPLTGNKQ